MNSQTYQYPHHYQQSRQVPSIYEKSDDKLYPQKKDSKIKEQYHEESHFNQVAEKPEDAKVNTNNKGNGRQSSNEDSLHRGSESSVKMVRSRVEIIKAENVPSSPNDQRNSGIVIRVNKVEAIGYLSNKLMIEIQNEGGTGRGAASTKQTKLVSIDDRTWTWDEDFYYNNNVVLDDNIIFILRDQNNKELAKAQVRNLSLFRKPKQGDEQSAQVERELIYLDLLKEGKDIARLFIEISFYQREDILGGVLMPNLSLKPPPNFVHRYNAIDSYCPTFQNKSGSRANCFNFYDGGTLPGFDNLEVFPLKIKRKNILK